MIFQVDARVLLPGCCVFHVVARILLGGCCEIPGGC